MATPRSGPGAAPDPLGDPHSMVVALATFRRPGCLTRLLPLLVEQVAVLDLPTDILVVDNDPAGGAAELVRGWEQRGVRYVHEPTPGIAAARNRALSESVDRDLLVFIDDDEVPTPNWLASLLDCWYTYRCEAVTGPVVPDFESDVDPWVVATGVFDRRRLPTGSSLGGAATNNLLLDLRRLRALDLSFDPRFGMSGGSDTMLSHALVRRGGVIRWCDEAEVVDVIPGARTTRAWTMRRTIRTSNDWARVELILAGTRGRRRAKRLGLAARGANRVLRGVAAWSAGSVTGRAARRATGSIDLASGVGLLLGAVGVTWHEYRRTAGAADSGKGTRQ